MRRRADLASPCRCRPNGVPRKVVTVRGEFPVPTISRCDAGQESKVRGGCLALEVHRSRSLPPAQPGILIRGKLAHFEITEPDKKRIDVHGMAADAIERGGKRRGARTGKWLQHEFIRATRFEKFVHDMERISGSEAQPAMSPVANVSTIRKVVASADRRRGIFDGHCGQLNTHVKRLARVTSSSALSTGEFRSKNPAKSYSRIWRQNT